VKVLFILKYREQPYGLDCGDWAYSADLKPLSSGLFNSASMVVRMLNDEGYEAKLVHVRDGNDIHRECVAYKPDVAVIEAFWCPPYKFDDLYKVLPNLKFIVRNHSETPFLANEGIAFGWMIEYLQKPNVYIAPNSPRMEKDTEVILSATGIDLSKILYLPNFYYFDHDPAYPSWSRKKRGNLDVGCFGAVRPLKNHMLQSVAAVKYAERHGLHLRFHINGNRVEGNGGPILKNLRETFKYYEDAELVEHAWTDAPTFRETVSKMDIMMQCSFSETFNIVAADATAVGVPVIGSKEIPWLTECVKADPTDLDDIVAKMTLALGLRGPGVVAMNRFRLSMSNASAVRRWRDVLDQIVE
jgi:glycosyltransferase involved in cell wall biosynthesis